MSQQRSILSFTGFKRKVRSRGELVETKAEKYARTTEPSVTCRVCDKTFKSTQARAQHEIWSHSYTSNTCTRNDPGNTSAANSTPVTVNSDSSDAELSSDSSDSVTFWSIKHTETGWTTTKIWKNGWVKVCYLRKNDAF